MMVRPDITFTKNREPFAFMRTARQLVVDYVREKNSLGAESFDESNVSIIWFTTNDGEWRVLLGTTMADGLYYRISHNGAETHLDVFKMCDSQTIQNKDD